MAASPRVTLRAFFGDFLGRLSGTSMTEPVSTTVWVSVVMVFVLSG